MGYLYVGIAFPKEKWFEKIPDISPKENTEYDWGLKDAKWESESKNITIKYIIRRMKNSISHANIEIENFDHTDSNYLEKISFHFHDEKPNGKKDPFDIWLSFKEVLQLMDSLNKHIIDQYEQEGLIISI